MITCTDNKNYTRQDGSVSHYKILVTSFENREDAEKTISAFKDFADNYVNDSYFTGIINDFEKSLVEYVTPDLEGCYTFSAEMEHYYDFVNTMLEVFPYLYNRYKALNDFYDQQCLALKGMDLSQKIAQQRMTPQTTEAKIAASGYDPKVFAECMQDVYKKAAENIK